MRRPQSIRGGVWYMGGRKRRRQRQIGGFLPLAAVTGPFIRHCRWRIHEKNIWG